MTFGIDDETDGGNDQISAPLEIYTAQICCYRVATLIDHLEPFEPQ